MSRERQLFSTTGILALVAVAAGAYIYFGEIRSGERHEKAHEATVRLMPFAADSVTQLEIQRPGEKIICRKQDGHWRIESPVHADGDDDTINKLLKDIDKARIDRTIEITHATSETLRETGLGRPTIMTVADPSRRVSFAVGKANPTDEFAYVKPDADGPRVALADRTLLDDGSKTLHDLRDKTALSLDTGAITGITLQAGASHVRLSRAPSATGHARPGWRIDSPIRAVADRGLVERTLDLVSNVRAERFAAESQDDLERFGLKPPRAMLRFDRQGGSDTILIGKKTVDGALTRDFACKPGGGPVFEINENLLDMAQKTPAEWRDKHATDFERADAKEIRLITPQRTVELLESNGAQGEEWHLAVYMGKVNESMSLSAAAKLPTAQKADDDRVQDILSRLSTIEAFKFLEGRTASDPALGLVTPSLKVEALDESGKLLASISFGASNGPNLYATSPHLGTVFLVKASETDRFRVGTAELAARY